MDSVIKSEVHYQEHTGELTHKTSQPTEGIILDRNAELRKNAGSIRDLGAGQEGGAWGRQVASIPFIVYEKAIRDGFELNHKDKDHAGKEMHRFLSTIEGRACLVQG
jgi:hypothetical protein